MANARFGCGAGQGWGGGVGPQGLSPAGGPLTSRTVPRAVLGRNDASLPAWPRLAGPGLCPWGWGDRQGTATLHLQGSAGREECPQGSGSFSSSPQRPWGFLGCSAARLWV